MAERFDHVVVRAKLQTEHPLVFLAPCGDHDDGDVRCNPDAAAHLHAVQIGQPQIQQDHVGITDDRKRLRRRPVADDLKPLVGEDLGEWVRNGLVVFDQKDTHPETLPREASNHR